MLIGVLIGFSIFGVGMTSYQGYKRRWLEAARYLVGTAIADAGYASMLLHKPWISLVVLPAAIVASVGYIVIARSQAREAASADRV